MHSLPRLATASRAFDLPLAGTTAERVVAALVAVELDDRERPLRLLTEALEQDAPFALWAVCRAVRRGGDPPRTVGQSAAWLAGTVGQELVWPEAEGRCDAASTDLPSAELGRWADLAGRSYGIARLASLVARYKSLDADQAYFLGLLHAAPDALCTASRTMHPPGRRRQSAARRQPGKKLQPKPADYQDVLPPSLITELAAVDASGGTNPSSVSDCVAAALRIAAGGRISRTAWPGFQFNRPQHAALVAAARKRWLDRSPLAPMLPILAKKLARLHELEGSFRRSLETEKLDALKELAYGAGHEINNPLANISARAQTLLPQEHDPQRRRLLTAINTQAFRAHEMITDMMLFARPPQPQLAEVNLVELLHTIVDELAPRAAAQHTQLVYRAPSAQLTAQVDPTQIAVAVRALCVNSLEALASGGRVELAIHVIEADFSGPAKALTPDETLQITVSDNGPGIPPEVRRHIFDPFYSGREAGRGLGFGLSKCWRIVSMHRGQIDVDSTPDGGARFAITLPRDFTR